MSDNQALLKPLFDESVMPEIGRFLDMVGPAERDADVEAQAPLFATAMQRHFPIDMPTALRICHSVLNIGREPRTRDLLGALAPLGVHPGWPYFAQQRPRELLGFLADAGARSQIAKQHGMPPMPIFAMSSSGSTYSTNVMGQIMDVPMAVVSLGHVMAYRPWVGYVAQFPIAVHDHLPPCPHNLGELVKAGVKRAVIQVRDPRQFFLSEARQAKMHGGSADLSDDYIRRVSPHIADWVNGWRVDAPALGIAVHVVRYEDLAADSRGFFTSILNFFNAPTAAHDRLNRALERAEDLRSAGGLNYRVGRPDEWKEVLTPGQIAIIGVACAPALAGLYSFS
jgi:hypothetical protein